MAVDYTMYSGDSRQLNIEITDETGAPVDVSTSSAVVYAIFRRNGEQVISKTLGAGVVTDTSVVTVDLEPADTADLAGDTYLHECQLITVDDLVYTVLSGSIKVLRDHIE